MALKIILLLVRNLHLSLEANNRPCKKYECEQRLKNEITLSKKNVHLSLDAFFLETTYACYSV